MSFAQHQVQTAISDSIRHGTPVEIFVEDMSREEVEAIFAQIEALCGSHTGTIDHEILVYTGEQSGKSWTLHVV